MFWLSALVLSLSIVLMRLGALSVWMSVLSLGLKVALLVIADLALILLWNQVVRVKG